MSTKGVLVVGLIVLSWIFEIILSEYNYKLGEIMGMAMLQPFIIIFFSIPLVIIYIIYRKIFNKEEKATAKKTAGIFNAEITTNDLYLLRTAATNLTINYQISNKGENNLSWTGHCTLSQGKPYSIILNAERTIEITRQETGFNYDIKDNQSLIGHLIISPNGLVFTYADNLPVYTAILETTTEEGFGAIADWLFALDTLQPFSSATTNSNIVIKNQAADILGKYYLSLKNMDLSFDTNNTFDLEIAAIFAIFFDASVID